VVITDINPYRLDLAQKLGITNAIDTRQKSLKDIQKELGMREGFDIGLEMSGNGHALNEMIDNLSTGAKIAMLGIQDAGTAVDWNKIVFKGMWIKGIYGREMYETWYKMEAMLKAGLDISAIITHRFNVDDFAEGFEIMAGGNSGKVILDWEK
jgi:threonine 3-dehydrogenase